jgi:hypothetical protein
LFVRLNDRVRRGAHLNAARFAKDLELRFAPRILAAGFAREL